MLVGAHVSSSGGLSSVVERARSIGAECVQVHLSAPQQWRLPNHPDLEVQRFCELSAQHGLGPNFAHAPYLINLASAEEPIAARSLDSLAAALTWAGRCNLAGVVVHLGSARGGPVEEAEARVARGLQRALALVPDVPLLLENSAGSGDCLGARFEQVGRLIRLAGGDARLQVCLDTAHAWGAGYDLRAAEGPRRLLEEVDTHVGVARLSLVHANDSRVALGSAVDRHENVGAGQIGEEGFARLAAEPALARLPWILEVPGFARQGPDAENVSALRRLAGVPAAAPGAATPS